MKTLGWAVLLSLSLVRPASAATAQVYPGCNVPPTTVPHSWYVDPVNGNDTTGTGSRTAPWKTLQSIVSSVNGASPRLTTVPYWHSTTSGWMMSPNTKAPVHPGDFIWLESGNYGNVVIGAANITIDNPEFVTVSADSGQTPVLSTLTLVATTNWNFINLKVQSLRSSTNGNPLVWIWDAGASYPVSNIIFQKMNISSQDDISGWSQAYWLANARQGLAIWGTAGGQYTTCISVTGSHISNVTTGAALGASQVLFSDNEIDHFGDDGLDYSGSNLAITKNYIHDNNDIGDGNHEDAMQGQIGKLATGVSMNSFSNILIDSNTIIRQTDPKLPFPTYLQGIDAFDEDWTNITVTNNLIIAASCNALSFSSIHNSVIANNTVVGDGLVSTPGCDGSTVVGDKTHEGASSSNTAVRNNLLTSLSVYNLDPGVEADHNVIISVNGKGGPFFEYVNGVGVFASLPGTYGNANIIDSKGAASEFVNFSPSTLTYNMLLKSGAPAIGAGIANGAPTVDLLGDPRSTPYTAGAYAYPR